MIRRIEEKSNEQDDKLTVDNITMAQLTQTVESLNVLLNSEGGSSTRPTSPTQKHSPLHPRILLLPIQIQAPYP